MELTLTYTDVLNLVATRIILVITADASSIKINDNVSSQIKDQDPSQLHKITTL